MADRRKKEEADKNVDREGGRLLLTRREREAGEGRKEI